MILIVRKPPLGRWRPPDEAPAPSMFSPAAREIAQRLGLKMGRANLEEFADTLLALAKNDRQILVVTSDSRGSGKLGPFGQAFPKQIVEVGIAEQNLVGITAGLAAAGKKSFAVSPACFLTARSLEQIKNDICYSDVPAKIIGISAGVSYGALGSTHHSLHDFAALRAIHNLTILVPADNFETRASHSRRGRGRASGLPPFRQSRRCTTCMLPAQNFKSANRSRCATETTWRSSPQGKQSFTALIGRRETGRIGFEMPRRISMHTIKPLDAAKQFCKRGDNAGRL